MDEMNFSGRVALLTVAVANKAFILIPRTPFRARRE
jgi:hypothetical protein